jgi:signal transduction histidine kinase
MMEDRFEFLKKIVHLANSSIGFEDRMQGILDLMVRGEKVEKACLLFMTPLPDTVEVKKVSPRDPNWEGISFSIHRTPLAEVLENRKALSVPRLNRKEHKALLRNPLFKGYESLILLPVEDDQLLYGVVGLLSRIALDSDTGRQETLQLAVRELAGVIRNSWFYTEAKKRIAELSVLHQVGRVIGSSLEPDELIQKAVTITAQVINAKGSALLILDRDSEEVIVEAEFGVVPPEVKKQILQDILARKGDLIYSVKREALPAAPPLDRKGSDQREGEAVSTYMCIRLFFKGPYRGRLCVYEKIPLGGQGEARFNEEELSTLSTIGNIIANSLENALTFQKVEALARKNEWMVRNLSTLYQIDSAMMTSTSLKDLPQIILEAITLKEGLKFNRAILLLADEERKFLTPMAWSIRRNHRAEGPPPKEEGLGNDALSGYFLRQAAEIRKKRQEADRSVQGIKIPLKAEAGILARTFLEGRSFLVKRASEDPRANKELAKEWNLESFAAVPILAKDRVIGVIEVDNFLDRRPITQDDLHILSMLAHQAGLALENARLYSEIARTNEELRAARERLIESEKMMAMGEMASGLAHEIRNPLVSIGGFARRLMRKFPDDEQVQSYVQVIVTEVERLEKILNEITAFSQDPRGTYKERDFNPIVEEALGLVRRELEEARIQVQTQWGTVPQIFGDNRQLLHVFYNLFVNAWQAMPQGGVLSVRTFVKKEGDRSWVVCEVADTGGGIPPELLHNIFNPFFTTKVHGSGLGLPIVHKIVTRHNGEVDIDNRPGEGVSFQVKLPPAREAKLILAKPRINGERDHGKKKNIDRR